MSLRKSYPEEIAVDANIKDVFDRIINSRIIWDSNNNASTNSTNASSSSLVPPDSLTTISPDKLSGSLTTISPDIQSNAIVHEIVPSLTIARGTVPLKKSQPRTAVFRKTRHYKGQTYVSGNDRRSAGGPASKEQTYVVLYEVGGNVSAPGSVFPNTSNLDNGSRGLRLNGDHGKGDNHKKGDSHKKGGSHSLEEEIAHALHLISVSLMACLVLETLLKAFCAGLPFFKRKLETFDFCIVLVSFIADLVFMQILPRFKIQDFVFILAFLLPWRVIRVVDSLVVAVQDHEHFRLKLMYSRKKKIQNSLRETEVKLQLFRAQCCALKRLCVNEGVPESKVDQIVQLDEYVVNKTGKSKCKVKIDNASVILLDKSDFPRLSPRPSLSNLLDRRRSAHIEAAKEPSKFDKSGKRNSHSLAVSDASRRPILTSSSMDGQSQTDPVDKDYWQFYWNNGPDAEMRRSSTFSEDRLLPRVVSQSQLYDSAKWDRNVSKDYLGLAKVKHAGSDNQLFASTTRDDSLFLTCNGQVKAFYPGTDQARFERSPIVNAHIGRDPLGVASQFLNTLPLKRDTQYSDDIITEAHETSSPEICNTRIQFNISPDWTFDSSRKTIGRDTVQQPSPESDVIVHVESHARDVKQVAGERSPVMDIIVTSSENVVNLGCVTTAINALEYEPKSEPQGDVHVSGQQSKEPYSGHLLDCNEITAPSTNLKLVQMNDRKCMSNNEAYLIKPTASQMLLDQRAITEAVTSGLENKKGGQWIYKAEVKQPTDLIQSHKFSELESEKYDQAITRDLELGKLYEGEQTVTKVVTGVMPEDGTKESKGSRVDANIIKWQNNVALWEPDDVAVLEPHDIALQEPDDFAILEPDDFAILEPDDVAVLEPDDFAVLEPDDVAVLEPDDVAILEPDDVAILEPNVVALQEPNVVALREQSDFELQVQNEIPSVGENVAVLEIETPEYSTLKPSPYFTSLTGRTEPSTKKQYIERETFSGDRETFSGNGETAFGGELEDAVLKLEKIKVDEVFADCSLESKRELKFQKRDRSQEYPNTKSGKRDKNDESVFLQQSEIGMASEVVPGVACNIISDHEFFTSADNSFVQDSDVQNAAEGSLQDRDCHANGDILHIV